MIKDPINKTADNQLQNVQEKPPYKGTVTCTIRGTHDIMTDHAGLYSPLIG